ncbi:MAG: hypothetical protein Kow0080_27240 [Candidatus Promineifilaceae bacterium]
MSSLVDFVKQTAVPPEHRANFHHLYFDIAWYGVLSGSAISFLAVFATRLGADGFQLGLLNAIPAIINLIFTLPAGQWLQDKPISRSVFQTAVWNRLFYAVWIFLPMLLAPSLQVWALIIILLVMSVPGTALAVGFNALFAAAVPPEWRGHVAGIRNGILSLTFMVTTLLCGWILEHVPFPVGYQIIFGLGFLGAIMSTVHLWFVKPEQEFFQGSPPDRSIPVGDQARPGLVRSLVGREYVGLRWLARRRGRFLSTLPILKGPFGIIVAVLFAFHLAQYMAIPLFPLYWVNVLHFSDADISYGNAVFYGAVLLGSMQLAWITRKWGHKRVLFTGVLLISSYPALTAVTQNLTLFLITSAIGGIAWSMVGGAIANYLLEHIPVDNRPTHLAWYNLGLNAAILLGSLAGPLIANFTGLVNALFLAAALRFAAGLAIWKWG